jgi:S1-C subfamily serine protease
MHPARTRIALFAMLFLTTGVAWAEGLPNPLHWLSKATPTPAAHSRRASAAVGVVVTAVATTRAAAHAGLPPGDVITEANRRPVRTLAEYQGALASVQNESDVLLLVERQGRRLFVALPRSG